MKLLNICNKVIEYSFYALFFLVPLVFTSNTSELFEFNKMWLTFGLTIIIGASWFSKMLLQRQILLCRTPLDIPIVLFLLSQVLSTIFSQDLHVSLWGYYSRWNGGLLSIISYIFLYYAFVSNLSSKTLVYRLLAISLTSGLIVALWGLPSHFGYDPTCLLFRRTFDVSCWTESFQPKIRIFSTLGQPDWLAAYLAILIPIAIAFGFQKTQNTQSIRNSDNQTVRQSKSLTYRVFRVFRNKQIVYILLVTLFYANLLYTRARSGFWGIWLALVFFATLYWWFNGKPKISFSKDNLKSPVVILTIGLLLITFVLGTPIGQLNKFTLGGIGSYFQKLLTPKTQIKPQSNTTANQDSGTNITDSANIRFLYVWPGAINAWRANPIFGTGVETFAFAYYKYKPIGQNLTSEWDYLYNKAHNEYLNYLANTGIVGLGTYLAMIGFFFTIVILNLFQDLKTSKIGMLKPASQRGEQVQHDTNKLLTLTLLASYLSILITNFFGFSVVIVNIYLFLIPAFVFVLTDRLNPQAIFVFPKELGIKNQESSSGISKIGLVGILFIILTSLFMILVLIRFWAADKNYAYGYNLDRAGNYQEAYPYLHKAVSERSGEPVFQDEMAVNDATLAVGLLLQKTATEGAQIKLVAESLVKEALETNNQITSSYPKNILFQKSRTRIFYLLSQVDARYLPLALTAIAKASNLAPNDAKISYNLGVLQGQNNQLDEAIQTLQNTLKLKRDYTDAYYALGLFYHQKAIDKNGKVRDFAFQKKAIETMQFILDHLQSNNGGAKQALDAWEK